MADTTMRSTDSPSREKERERARIRKKVFKKKGQKEQHPEFQSQILSSLHLAMVTP
jgi:hypothetical protein